VVNVSHAESIEELVDHPVIEEAEDVKDLIGAHVVEDALEALAVQEDDIRPPLRGGSLLPSGITQSSEVVEELDVGEGLENVDDLVEIVHLVENKFEFGGRLLLEHLLDLLRPEFGDLLRGQRVDELFELGIERGLIAKLLIEYTINFLILEVGKIDELVPLVS
jgi:hypothetical protein